ncbi:MAG TPA: thioredoxin family protein [Hyphomicrobiales bacterium]|nr:thioredoxin family protein [Hyphomicrobiales bacterium]
MRHSRFALALVGLFALGACAPADHDGTASITAPSATALSVDAPSVDASSAAAQIDWREEDVLAAFAEATDSGRLVLLYWGAEWCPPCHRLRAGLFQDPAFIARTRDFVPVYLDGDSTGAQRWGEHFAIQGYPTLIILRANQSEITRLSGGEDPDEIDRALQAAQQGQASIAELFARAEQAPAELDADAWALLAAYGWEVDVSDRVPADTRATLLRQLAAAAPDAALQRRFTLLALADDAARDVPPPTAEEQAQIRMQLYTVLTDTNEAKRSRWTLIDYGAALIARAGGTPEQRRELETALVAAQDELFADASLPLVDRVLTVSADLALHRLNAGEEAAVPPALLEKVRARAAWVDATAQTPQERQSAIYYAAGLLTDAGDAADAERLLLAELPRSATPYYYMPSLAELTEARGDVPQALSWLQQGYETSNGLATRVQWGTLYASGLLRLTPGDTATIEQVIGTLIDELAHPDSYHQRTRERLSQLAGELHDWSASHPGTEAILQRLDAHMQETCAPAQSDADARTACLHWLTSA